MMAALAGDGAPTLRNLHKWSLKLGASSFQEEIHNGTGAVESTGRHRSTGRYTRAQEQFKGAFWVQSES